MRIRNRIRGTNQHQAKGELTGVKWCDHCGQFNDLERIELIPHPVKTKVTKCKSCGGSL